MLHLPRKPNAPYAHQARVIMETYFVCWLHLMWQLGKFTFYVLSLPLEAFDNNFSAACERVSVILPPRHVVTACVNTWRLCAFC